MSIANLPFASRRFLEEHEKHLGPAVRAVPEKMLVKRLLDESRSPHRATSVQDGWHTATQPLSDLLAAMEFQLSKPNSIPQIK